MSRSKRAEVPSVPTPPPAEETLWVPIYSAVTESQINLVALNDGIEGVNTHFHLNRTIPCIGKHSHCICETVMLAKRWKGYLGCWCPCSQRRVLAEITVDAYRSAERQLCGDIKLRGRRIGLFRLGPKVNSPARIIVGGVIPEEGMACLPEPLQVMRHLYKIWGIDGPIKG